MTEPPNQNTPPPISYIDPPLIIEIYAQQTHVASETMQELFEPSDLKRIDAQIRECYFVMKKVKQHPFGYFFHLPVNPYHQGIHNYIETVNRPIDLYTISYKLANNYYQNPNNFNEDMMLLFNNALVFNKDNQNIVEQIRDIQKYYAQIFQELVAKCEKMIMTNEYLGEERRSVKRKINRPPKKLRIKLTKQQTVQIVREHFDEHKLKMLAVKLNSINQVRKRLIIKTMNRRFNLSFKQNFILKALNEQQLLYLVYLTQDEQQQNYGCAQEQMKEYQQGKRVKLTRYGYEDQQSQFDLDDS